MDVKELVKFQVMSQIGGGMGQSHNMQKGDSKHTLRMMFLQMVVMAFISILDDLMKGVQKLFCDAKDSITAQCQKKVQDNISITKTKMLSDTSVALNTRHDLSYFVMTRVYLNNEGNTNAVISTEQEETNNIVDAVLAHISKLNNVPIFTLIGNGQVMVTFKEKPIQISREIYCKIDNISFTTTGNVSSIKLTLMSNTVSASDIISYVRNIYNNYLEEIKNSIGNNIYFFDQKSRESQVPSLPVSDKPADIINHKRMIISTAPKQLSFTISPFYSNKKFSNIYGKEIREIEKRVNFFLENKEWYDSKGVPYQLGLLLSGIPGAGKTSVVRAIANCTKRHIVNVNFANITTASQLKNLFFSEKLQVYTDQSLANTASYHIPLEQRLYVLEEIDAIGDIVKQRGDSTPNSNITVNDELTLADILTVLDGTMEAPGRMLVMTTNHPELLDKALIRPGRIDVKVHFDYADQDLIAEMYKSYMDQDLPIEYKHKLPDRMLSPAEVGQVLFRHFNVDTTLDDIIKDFQETAANLHAQRNMSSMSSPSLQGIPDEVQYEEQVDTVKQVDSDNKFDLPNDTTRKDVDDRTENVDAPKDTNSDKPVQNTIIEGLLSEVRTKAKEGWCAYSTDDYPSGIAPNHEMDIYERINENDEPDANVIPPERRW